MSSSMSEKAKHKGSSLNSSTVVVLAPKILIKTIYTHLSTIKEKKGENEEFFGSDGKSFRYSMDSLVYICSKISSLKAQKRFKNLDKVPISSTVLLHEIGRNYRKYINLLLDNGIIETDNHYVVGDEENGRKGKCKCYCISNKSLGSDLVEDKITKKSLLGKILDWKERMLGEIESDDMLSNIYGMMKEFKIDLSTAVLDTPGERRCKKGTLAMELAKARDINAGELYIHKDHYNRIHTNFTNISKNIRKTGLTFHGEHVSEIDIVSSQPTLLYALLVSWFKKCENHAKEGADGKYFIEEPSKRVDIRQKYVNRKNKYHGSNMFACELNENYDRLGFERYSDMLEKASRELAAYKMRLDMGIYEFFKEVYSRYFWKEMTRKAIKKEFVSYVFGNGKKPYNYYMDEAWKLFFPTLRKALMHLKSYDYRALSHELQRNEGSFMFGTLAPELNKAGIKYVTIHDSIAVPKSQEEVAFEIFSECLERASFGGRVKVE